MNEQERERPSATGHRRWLLALAIAAGCASPVEPLSDTDDVGQRREAVYQPGGEDVNNAFSGVPYIRYDNPNPASDDVAGCTATLVTPEWIVTAKHCLGTEGNLYRSTAPWSVRFTPDPLPLSSVPPNQLETTSGLAVAYHGDASFNRHEDVAWIQLSNAVPANVATPTRPLFNAWEVGSCRDQNQTLGAAVVGYSGGGPHWLPNCYEGIGVRRRSSAHNYDFVSEPSGTGAYERTFAMTPFGGCGQYHGGVSFGDSGGPLFDLGSGALCGVISSFGPVPMVPPLIGVFNDMAALDTPSAVSWTQAVLGHPTQPGMLKGECPALTASNDPDGDGRVGFCDDCPFVYNPDQPGPSGIYGYDDDADGIGDACDLCPEDHDAFASSYAANGNVEAEYAAYAHAHDVALGYPPEPLGAFGGIRLSYYTAREPSQGEAEAAAETAAALRRDYLRPNSCDPTPRLSIARDYGTMPPTAPTPGGPGWPSICSIAPQLCRWVGRNRYVVEADHIEGGGTVDVGVRWCECDIADTGTMEGRRLCALSPTTRCGQVHHAYGQHGYPNQAFPEWEAIDEVTVAGNTQPVLGHTVGQGSDFEVDWDFSASGSSAGAFGDREGVFWASVRQQLPANGPTHLADYYSSGDLTVSREHPRMEYPELAPGQEILCPSCPYGIAVPVDDYINPPYLVQVGGFAEGPRTDALVSSIGRGDVLVRGSNWQALEQLTGVTSLGTEVTTMLALSPEDGSVRGRAVVDGNGSAARYVGYDQASAPASWPDGVGVVMSSRLQVAVAFGGVASGQRGAFNTSGRRRGSEGARGSDLVQWFDVRTREWTRHEVEGLSEVSEVEAATFAERTEAAYFVTPDREGRRYIGRFHPFLPSQSVQVLHYLEDLSGVTDYFLSSSGPYLVLSLAREDGTGLLQVFTTATEQRLALVGQQELEASPIRSAIVTEEGVILSLGQSPDAPAGVLTAVQIDAVH